MCTFMLGIPGIVLRCVAAKQNRLEGVSSSASASRLMLGFCGIDPRATGPVIHLSADLVGLLTLVLRRSFIATPAHGTAICAQLVAI